MRWILLAAAAVLAAGCGPVEPKKAAAGKLKPIVITTADGKTEVYNPPNLD